MSLFAVSFHAGDFPVCSPQLLLNHTFHSFVVSLSGHIFSNWIGMQYSAQNDQGPVHCPRCFPSWSFYCLVVSLSPEDFLCCLFGLMDSVSHECFLLF